MIRHIIKMIWNRKKSMSLLLIEIFLSFIVAFFVCDMLITSIYNYSRPLGFEYKNVWDVRFEATKGEPFGNLGAENAAKYRLLLNEIKTFPEVKQADFVIGNIPYSNSRFGTSYEYQGKIITSGVSYVGDDYFEAMRMTLVEGRWFNSEDNAAVNDPIVVDETFSKNLFGDNTAIGEIIQEPTDNEKADFKQYDTVDLDKEPKKYRIVGVVKTFRPRGELNEPEGEIFRRQQWDDSSIVPYAAMVRVRDGISGSFELQLQRRLASLAPDINFRITPLSEARDFTLRDMAIAIVTPMIIAVFLLFNVVLGLFGIFWQSVSRRRGEIGLRRALGADSRLIPLQIWGETIAMGTLAILAGLPIVVNLAVLGVSKPIGSGIFFLSFICASGLIYFILTICAIYPSLLASRVQPAEALHNE
jgi:putative ABC transport system permease protein